MIIRNQKEGPVCTEEFHCDFHALYGNKQVHLVTQETVIDRPCRRHLAHIVHCWTLWCSPILGHLWLEWGSHRELMPCIGWIPGNPQSGFDWHCHLQHRMWGNGNAWPGKGGLVHTYLWQSQWQIWNQSDLQGRACKGWGACFESLQPWCILQSWESGCPREGNTRIKWFQMT